MEIDEQPQTTLRDSISEAFEQHEQQPETGTETAAETAERLRDEKGRFASSKQEEAALDVAAEAMDEVAPEPKVIPRPSSWKKDYEEDWPTLPERIREYINEREGQYAKGVSTYKNQWDQAAPIYEAVAPFLPELQQHGIQPQQWIQNLGNAHRTLALGTQEQKLQMFAKLATDYGVPLQALTGQQYDPQVSTLMQELNQLKTQFSQTEAERKQAEQQAVVEMVLAFSADKPNFSQVEETMIGILQSPLNLGATPQERLQNAYDKALRLNDELWQQQQAEQAKAAEAERQKALAEKKAKAVSPRSTSPTGAMNASGGKKSLRDTLSESIDAIAGGHI